MQLKARSISLVGESYTQMTHRLKLNKKEMLPPKIVQYIELVTSHKLKIFSSMTVDWAGISNILSHNCEPVQRLETSLASEVWSEKFY